MNSFRLTDLDELVLTIRDKSSRSYILEAVNAYRGGAYRAAIVATWIAVSYDIIAKIRELASQSDRQASANTDPEAYFAYPGLRKNYRNIKFGLLISNSSNRNLYE
ncbi:MAG: hypothetical protein RMY62_004475 [Nostoc sp. ZfuVER08]|uniref:Uncharacterized protein n=1 Tax=Nostoc punctiforme FACHB-252 TaxID=1357509 RepID=A0ABR8H1R5_NOSPU|nr:hypothetical protein [Nostoc punctiforme]MBD2609761.1 hypothetical protein [Nostoc punctiforme FACHB-252]MDZ8012965.1 hypothetical protein [Nostoc sp. ZfuVER08]